jgi:casein kinase 1
VYLVSPTQVRLILLTFLGSVFLGKDILTENEVALKIGHAGSSTLKLSYEHDVYKTISGSAGTSRVLWYGKEGTHEIIVLEYLGASLGNLISERRFDSTRIFSYASQMVRLLYTKQDRAELSHLALSNYITTCATLHPS